MNKRCTRDDVYSFITKGGLEGRTFGEIQRFVVEKNGRNYDEMKDQTDYGTGKVRRVRKNRGYWCDNLCGSRHPYINHPGSSRRGILGLCSIKVGKNYVSKKFADMV